MKVTVPIALTAEEEAALAAQAEAQGVSVNSLLRKAVLEIIAAPPHGGSHELSAEQWEKEFEAWLDSLADIPTLSDEAIRRENVYTREDEWR